MAVYEILDDQGEVINAIVADEVFVERAYPGHYRQIPDPPIDYSSQNKVKASELLIATDFVNQPDAIDQSRSPHLLNQAEFLDYREIIRRIAVNPPSEEIIDWPALPAEQWGP